MDASYKIQRGIHVHLIQFFMCPEFWVHIIPETVFPRTREDGFFEIKKNALTKINFSDIICTESKIEEDDFL